MLKKLRQATTVHQKFIYIDEKSETRLERRCFDKCRAPRWSNIIHMYTSNSIQYVKCSLFISTSVVNALLIDENLSKIYNQFIGKTHGEWSTVANFGVAYFSKKKSISNLGSNRCAADLANLRLSRLRFLSDYVWESHTGSHNET